MRAAIFDPYLDSLGGGERYMLSSAKVLIELGWNVDIECKNPEVPKKIPKRMGFDLKGARFIENVKRGEGYDLVFWLSDGSIPTLLGRKNILHFQRPFHGVDGKSLVNRMKLFRVSDIVVNSLFTKSFIDNEFPKESTVIYPPVDVEKFKAKRKEKLILYVGRFSQLEQSKGHGVLLEVFEKYHKRFKDWKLVLAGGSDVGRTSAVDDLKRWAFKIKNVDVLENPDFKELRDLYGKATFFWSAAGYGVDEVKSPEKMEHFGITVVEAMAAGAVPIVYDGGGHKEIVKPGINGYLWKEKSELSNITRKLIGSKKAIGMLSKKARVDSKDYGYDVFQERFLKLVNG